MVYGSLELTGFKLYNALTKECIGYIPNINEISKDGKYWYISTIGVLGNLGESPIIIEGSKIAIYDTDKKELLETTITYRDNFDFMPIGISKNEILFIRVNNEGNCSLVKLSQDEERVLGENLVFYENINYIHMVFNKDEGMPEHFSNSNVYMTVLRGTLSIQLGDQEYHKYVKGDILQIPNNIKMNVRNLNDETLELIVVKAPAPSK